MNIRTPYMLVAVMSVVGALAVTPAFASELDTPAHVDQGLIRDIPISVWTDAEVYDHQSIIMVQGAVAHVKDAPVTITVTSPINNIVTIRQVDISSDGTYSTTLNTAGNLWKYDGTYTIRVQYGSHDVNNKVLVELTGGVAPNLVPVTPSVQECMAGELDIDGHCIPFSITGGSVTGGKINAGTSIIVNIMSTEPGKITLSPTSDVFSGLELVLVDGEQWDDVSVDGDDIMIYFPAGAEQVEIIGKFVVPEFGTIAALVLAAAIASIIAVSARSRLSIMPKY